MIKLSNVSKTYFTKDGNVEACKDINLQINEGEIFGIIGFSGAEEKRLHPGQTAGPQLRRRLPAPPPRPRQRA